MWIRWVRAHPFGPLTDDRLELAEGMTIVTGPNEAGKSTWHAAIYAALCGMRRGQGPRKFNEEFAARHKPWDSDEWRVSSEVRLPDGRTIELTHDLAGRVDSSARDTTLGTDTTSEIMYDGAPDGSRWLGLDRQTFLAVASIRQAQVLTIADDADALQEHLQRAAATAGVDETAATALAAIDRYAGEHVGTERSYTRPLAQAQRRLAAAEAAYAEAEQAHSDRLDQEGEVAALEAKADAAQQAVRVAEARSLSDQARDLAERLRQAREISERIPSPPPASSTADELTTMVATALHDWDRLLAPTELAGPSAAELEAQLDALPPPPTGDLRPAEEVIGARRELEDARTRLGALLAQQPSEPSPVASLSESELVDLARELEAPVPAVDPALESAVQAMRSNTDNGPRSGPSWTLLIPALAALINGGIFLATGNTPLGLGLLVIGAGLGLAGLVSTRTAGDAGSTPRELIAAESRLQLAQQLHETAAQRRGAATQRAVDAGVEPDPVELRRLADAVRRAEISQASELEREARERQYRSAIEDAADDLRASLAERGVEIEEPGDLAAIEAAVERYENECRVRGEQATLAGRRPALEAALEARHQAERRLAEEQDRSARAGDALRQAASAAQVADDEAGLDAVAERLRAWQHQRAERLEKLEADQADWTNLKVLLDGRSLEDLEAQATHVTARAEELATELDRRLIEAFDLGDRPDQTIQRLRAEARDLGVAAARAQSSLDASGRHALSVPEAEERLAAARAELARVEQLSKVLHTTRSFLAAAQERVHRDIAPVLAEKVGDRLARVTGGRYEKVTVDPESLRVDVQEKGGQWRKADRLSHGTAEQVYLLLRVAMAEILTSTDASCPLLMDDSTVQSDASRTSALLSVLHEVSADHQIVLFSQEAHVAEWAQQHLTERDRHHELAPAS